MAIMRPPGQNGMLQDPMSGQTVNPMGLQLPMATPVTPPVDMGQDPGTTGSGRAPMTAPLGATYMTPADATTATNLAETIQFVINRRRSSTVEAEWLRNLDCWKARHRRQGFKGEWFNHYVPVARRALEKFVTRCKQMLFPSPDFFEVYPILDYVGELGQLAESWKTYLLWLLTQRVKIRPLASQLIRSFCLFQRAISKAELVRGNDGLFWPGLRAVDPFMFYVWPETATNIDDAQLKIEIAMLPWDKYQSMVDQGVCMPLDRAKLTAPEWPYFYVQRLGQMGLTPPDYPSNSGNPTPQSNANGSEPPPPPPVGFVELREVWWKESGKDVQAWLVKNYEGGPICVRTNREYPANPYRMAVGRPLSGEHFTSSMMSDLEPLNVVFNDQMNMTLEGEATILFPPTAVNPDLVARSDSLVYRPRAKWLVAPEGTKVLEQSGTNLNFGFQGISTFGGLVDSFSGANPLSDGTPTRGMPRAGFAISTLVNLSMSDIREVAETIEDEILTPALHDLAKLTLSLPPQQIILIPGTEAIAQNALRVGWLKSGEYAFKWVGTLQSQDLQIRAQRLLSFMNTVGKMQPQMAQDGYAVDWATIGKRLWRDGMGERGADSIIYFKGQPPPSAPQPPKVSISLKGDLDPFTAHGLATPQPPPQAPPTNPAPSQTGQVPTGPPAPASPEQGERQDSRQMAEAGAGPGLLGTNAGAGTSG